MTKNESVSLAVTTRLALFDAIMDHMGKVLDSWDNTNPEYMHREIKEMHTRGTKDD